MLTILPHFRQQYNVPPLLIIIWLNFSSINSIISLEEPYEYVSPKTIILGDWLRGWTESYLRNKMYVISLIKWSLWNSNLELCYIEQKLNTGFFPIEINQIKIAGLAVRCGAKIESFWKWVVVPLKNPPASERKECSWWFDELRSKISSGQERRGNPRIRYSIRPSCRKRTTN